MLRILYAVALCVVAPSSAFAHWQYTHWGMTVDEVIVASGKKAVVATDGPANSTSLEKNILDAPYSAGRFNFTVHFLFDEAQRLSKVQLQLNDAKKDCVPLTGDLLNSYGPAKQSQSEFSEADRWWDKAHSNALLLFKIGDDSCSLYYSELKEAGAKGGL